MQRFKWSTLGLMVLGGALLSASAQASPYGSFCREYTRDVQIGGRLQNSYGQACLQPDGSWQMQSSSEQGVPDVTLVGGYGYNQFPVAPVYTAPVYVQPQPYYVPQQPYYAPPPASNFVLGLNFGGRDWGRGRGWNRRYWDRPDCDWDRGYGRGYDRGWNRGGDYGHGHGRWR
ncbi:MAG: hypothetical protein K2Q12_08465 [Rickettsiales bacterium]|nr:hypothetical protein [Rickettsiales bacterium]